MKNLTSYISEKMVYTKANSKYFPKTKEELKEIIEKLVNKQSAEDIINLNSIDTSEITDMSDLFDEMEGLVKINISDWDVSKVKRMDYMFRCCANLEKIIGIEDWDVSKVENMQGMFDGCKLFNQNISKWNVSKVENMASMFYECTSFNQPLDDWNVSNVEDMSWLFSECEKFNQDISSWNVFRVTYMTGMFDNCKSFNQDISKWNVSNVTDTNRTSMFYKCPIEEKYKPKFK